MLQIRPVWIPSRIAWKYDAKKEILAFNGIFIDMVNEIKTYTYNANCVVNCYCNKSIAMELNVST